MVGGPASADSGARSPGTARRRSSTARSRRRARWVARVDTRTSAGDDEPSARVAGRLGAAFMTAGPTGSSTTGAPTSRDPRRPSRWSWPVDAGDGRVIVQRQRGDGAGPGLDRCRHRPAGARRRRFAAPTVRHRRLGRRRRAPRHRGRRRAPAAPVQPAGGDQRQPGERRRDALRRRPGHTGPHRGRRCHRRGGSPAPAGCTSPRTA